MKVLPLVILTLFLFATVATEGGQSSEPASEGMSSTIFGFRVSSAEVATEAKFLAVPDPQLAEQHLRTLTKAPHVAGAPEDKATADYVAQNSALPDWTRRWSNTAFGLTIPVKSRLM